MKNTKKEIKKEKNSTSRNIGILNIVPPEKTCNDINCPFHGKLTVRGKILEAKVVSNKMDKSAVVSWNRLVKVPKYERYMKKRSKITVHVPPCINIEVGDKVKIMECRPLSKTKKFVIIQKM